MLHTSVQYHKPCEVPFMAFTLYFVTYLFLNAICLLKWDGWWDKKKGKHLWKGEKKRGFWQFEGNRKYQGSKHKRGIFSRCQIKAQNNQLRLLLSQCFFCFFFDAQSFCPRSWKLAPERDKDAIFFQLPYEKCQVEGIYVKTADKSFREHPISAGGFMDFFFKRSRIPVNITQSCAWTFCTEWLTAHTHHWGSL